MNGGNPYDGSSVDNVNVLSLDIKSIPVKFIFSKIFMNKCSALTVDTVKAMWKHIITSALSKHKASLSTRQ